MCTNYFHVTIVGRELKTRSGSRSGTQYMNEMTNKRNFEISSKIRTHYQTLNPIREKNIFPLSYQILLFYLKICISTEFLSVLGLKGAFNSTLSHQFVMFTSHIPGPRRHTNNRKYREFAHMLPHAYEIYLCLYIHLLGE